MFMGYEESAAADVSGSEFMRSVTQST